jgi:phosphatidylglycerophosphate synthase
MMARFGSTATLPAPRPLLLGAVVQILLLGSGLIAAALPLGWRGQAVAFTLYAAIAALVLGGLGRHPYQRFGPANAVTLARATAATLLLGVYAEVMAGGALRLDAPLQWALAATAASCLALDGLDGWLARRGGVASDFGARFDMETDALLVLALALLVHAAGQAGLFVLTSGLFRYIFVAAGRLWPPLRAPLPPSFRRKAACVLQTALLIAALAPAVPPAVASGLCLAGLALLGYSFAVDCARLARGVAAPGRDPI